MKNNEMISSKLIRILQDVDLAILVMRDAGKWLAKSGKNPSKWWQLQNLNRKFLLQYAKPEEFYVVLIDNKPAAAAILQINQQGQDWQIVDKGSPRSALYIHWLCVTRQFAGKNLPGVMVDFAKKLAKEKDISLLRADTNAAESKLRRVYEDLGFKLLTTLKEDYRTTAFYQMKL